MDLARIHPGRKGVARWSCREWLCVPLILVLMIAVVAAMAGATLAIAWLVRAGVGLVIPAAGTIPLEAYWCAPLGVALLAAGLFRPRFSRASRKPFTAGRRAEFLALGALLTMYGVMTFVQAKH